MTNPTPESAGERQGIFVDGQPVNDFDFGLTFKVSTIEVLGKDTILNIRPNAGVEITRILGLTEVILTTGDSIPDPDTLFIPPRPTGHYHKIDQVIGDGSIIFWDRTK